MIYFLLFSIVQIKYVAYWDPLGSFLNVFGKGNIEYLIANCRYETLFLQQKNRSFFFNEGCQYFRFPKTWA
ncbi:MAG: hypothetical protein DRI57_08405 [Deltaproteobacteria bacterium]|nr:MAG: hypothetical protein DRI57_08405 [Deltaproteobacteria bacterium]